MKHIYRLFFFNFRLFHRGCRLLNDVSEDDSIFHMVVRSPDKEKPNDFVLLVSTRKPENKKFKFLATNFSLIFRILFYFSDSYKVAMRSVAIRSFPEKTVYERASVISSGFIITSSENEICSEVNLFSEFNYSN